MLLIRNVGSLGLVLLMSVAFGCSGGSSNPMDAGMDSGPPPPTCEEIERYLEIPLDYTLASDHLDVTSASGNTAKVLIGPWGAHTQPHTGHPEGNVKADWAAVYAMHRTDPLVAELSFDGVVQETGNCDYPQRCAVALTDVYARLVDYQLPEEARVVRVEKYNALGEFEVEVEYCPYRYMFGHVGAISSAVIDLMVAAGYDDPSGSVPLGENLITGDPIVVPGGTPICRPNLVMESANGNASYGIGANTIPDVPWQDIEWTAIHMGDSVDNVARPEYDYLDPSVRAALADILLAQAQLAGNFRYENLSFVEDWMYTAEHVLVATDPFDRAPQTTLTGGIGGWYEHPEDSSLCMPLEEDACNDVFSIFQIHKEGALYDAALYASPDVSWLVYRKEMTGNMLVAERFGEVVSPASPNEQSGELVIRWRTGTEEYQRAAYAIDVDGRMRLRYGTLIDAMSVATLADVPAVAAIDGLESCADADVFCYSGVAYGRL